MLFIFNSPEMIKKGANVSKKSPVISSSEGSMKIHRNVTDSSSSHSRPTSKVSSTILNDKKANSSRGSEISKSSSSSKLSLDGKPSLEMPICNVDELTSRQMHESLVRLKKNAVQPFTFLTDILDEKHSNEPLVTEKIKPTEIDLQLAALTRRVKLNKSLLERTNERVKEINFLVKRNAMTASRELNYGETGSVGGTKASGDDVTDSESALNTACPGIMELKRTINVTKEMLSYVKKICTNEIEMKDLPRELSEHMT